MFSNCFWTQYENAKEMKLGATVTFYETKHTIIEASYVIDLKIAQQKIPIGETLTRPCALKMIDVVIGKRLEKNLLQFHF